MLLDRGNLEALARGAAVFGAGGGGDPRIGHLMAAVAVEDCGPVAVLDLDDLPADGMVLPVAMVGAPTVMAEKIPNGSEGRRIQEAYERRFAKPVVALMCGEMGGINGLIPVAWAARAGLPLADADLVGRAFPEIQMASPNLHGLPIAPCVVTDERANTVTFDTGHSLWAERLVRSVSVVMGGAACMALYPLSVEQARWASVRGSVSRAVAVGEVARRHSPDPVSALEKEIGAIRLIEGKVIDVERHTTDGFARGSALVGGTGKDAALMLRIEFQNENLVALIGGEILASVPDIITVLDAHTAEPIVTEQLRYGQRVTAVAFPCNPVWRTNEGLALAGPRAFGYDIDYVPLEARHG